MQMWKSYYDVFKNCREACAAHSKSKYQVQNMGIRCPRSSLTGAHVSSSRTKCEDIAKELGYHVTLEGWQTKKIQYNSRGAACLPPGCSINRRGFEIMYNTFPSNYDQEALDHMYAIQECGPNSTTLIPGQVNGGVASAADYLQICESPPLPRPTWPESCSPRPTPQPMPTAPTPMPPAPTPMPPAPTPMPTATKPAYCFPHEQDSDGNVHNDMPLCEDGTYQWSCVSGNHGKRLQCPFTAPNMCAKKACDGDQDHCCEVDCGPPEGPYGGPRHPCD